MFQKHATNLMDFLIGISFFLLGAGSVEVEFVIRDDPQWSVKQEEIRSLDLKYSASWKTIVT